MTALSDDEIIKFLPIAKLTNKPQVWLTQQDAIAAIRRALLAAQPAQERQTYKPGNGGDCAICRQPEGDHYRHGNDCPDMRGVGQAE